MSPPSFTLSFKQVVQAASIDTHQHQVSGLPASLQSETCSGQLDKYRGAPTCARAARSYTLAILGADEKRSLFEARYNRNAVGLSGNIQRNALIRGCHQLVQDRMRSFYACIQFRYISRVCGTHTGKTDANQRNSHELFHLNSQLSLRRPYQCY